MLTLAFIHLLGSTDSTPTSHIKAVFLFLYLFPSVSVLLKPIIVLKKPCHKLSLHISRRWQNTEMNTKHHWREPSGFGAQTSTEPERSIVPRNSKKFNQSKLEAATQRNVQFHTYSANIYSDLWLGRDSTWPASYLRPNDLFYMSGNEFTSCRSSQWRYLSSIRLQGSLIHCKTSYKQTVKKLQ